MTWLTRMLSVLTLAVPVALAGLAAPAQAAPLPAYVTVFDSASSRALPGAAVSVYDVDPVAAPDAQPLATVPTNSGGRASFDLTFGSGPYYTQVTADGHQTTSRTARTVTDADRDLGSVSVAPYTGTLTATVRTPTGGDPGCGRVTAFRTEDRTEARTLSTSANGQVSGLLPIGSYSFRFDDTCDAYPATWLGADAVDAASATTYTVNRDATTALGTVVLDDGAVVSGIVTRSTTGAPLATVDVILRDVRAGTSQVGRSGTDGRYRIPAVGPGTYLVDFYDPIGELDTTAAQTSLVVGRADLARNYALHRVVENDAATLRGTVTGGPANVPLVQVQVLAQGVTAGSSSYFTSTARDGSYAFQIPDGDYLVRFGADLSRLSPYLPEWYVNAPTPTRAVSVHVAAGTATVANARLVALGSIAGHVTLPARPTRTTMVADDTYLELIDADGEPIGYVDLDAQGNYAFDGLEPGAYRIVARGGRVVSGDAGDAYQGWVRQFYAQKYSLTSATVLTVGDGAARSGVNFTLSDRLSAYVAPKVTGTAKVASTLTATPGTWTLAVNTTFDYQWYRISASGSTAITGATSRTYKVSSSDVGKRLRVVVHGSNRYDEYQPGVASSAPTGTVVR